MTNPVDTSYTEQTYAMAMQIMALTQQKVSGDIALKLVESAVQNINAPQDPSTVTPSQIQHPIDIRV